MAVYNEENKSKWTKDKKHYYFRCYYTDIYGNRKQYQSKMYLTSREAKVAETEFLSQINKHDIVDNNISFEKVFYEWLDFKKTIIKSTTYYTLKHRCIKHILNYFKDYKLHSIKINVLSEWNNQILNLNNSIDLKNRIISIMKEILSYARDNYDYDSKIIGKLRIQKIEKRNEIKDSEWNFWTYEEFQQFINIVDDDFYKLMFYFLYFTGLRFGEFVALTWKDIDFNKNIIKVNKQLTNKVENERFKIIDPKSNNSFRNIGLNDELIDMLKNHKKSEEKIYGFNDDMYIFGNVNYIARTTFKNHLNKYINIAKVKKITPHGFRHSHVSLLIHLGCDSREVADRIGDTVQVVEKTYYHMFPEKRQHTVEVLNNIKL